MALPAGTACLAPLVAHANEGGIDELGPVPVIVAARDQPVETLDSDREVFRRPVSADVPHALELLQEAERGAAVDAEPPRELGRGLRAGGELLERVQPAPELRVDDPRPDRSELRHRDRLTAARPSTARQAAPARSRTRRAAAGPPVGR